MTATLDEVSRSMKQLLRGVLFALSLVVLSLVPMVAAQGAEPDAPLIPRSQMMAVDELRPGMKGVGKSVFTGTKIEDFGVTVIGVLRKVDFDGDIILVRIDWGPPVSQNFGVVQGMSGSPIYVNGKLIGALAYAWPFAKEPIAGVTPIAQMLEAYQPGSSPVRLQGSLRAAEAFTFEGKEIRRGVVAPSRFAMPAIGQDTVGLVPIGTPVLVSGLSNRLIGELRKAFEPLSLVPLAGGGAMGHVDTKIVPGQAVGARLVGGDLDMTAVGTVTYVKDDVVIAFGHPMASLGTTDLPLVAAYVHGVLPSTYVSFKLASGGQTLGHFTEDRPWCIGGRLGGESSLIDAALTIKDLERTVERKYTVDVIRNRTLTSMLLVSILAGAVDSVGPPMEGTTEVRFELEAEGLPQLVRENTYTVDGGGGILALLLGTFGGAQSATGELRQILDVLQQSEFGEARLKQLSVDVELSESRRLARLEDIHIPSPIVQAGDEVPLMLTLRTSDGGLKSLTETVRIPENCPPGRVRIGVAGGRDAERVRARLQISEPRPVSMTQMVQQMLGRPSNDDLVMTLALPTVGVEARGFVLNDLPPATIDLLRSATANRLRVLRDYQEQRVKTEWVVSGSAVLSVTVDGKEKDKTGRLPSPDYAPPRYEQIGGGFIDFLTGVEGEVSSEWRVHPLDNDEEINFDSPPSMPSWDAVESLGEGEIEVAVVAATSEKRKKDRKEKTEAIGRVASVWQLRDPKELLYGEAEGTAVLSRGGITLGPKPSELAHIDARCLWSTAVLPDGSVYVGAWVDGSLKRITPDGEIEVVLETDRAGIQSLAVSGEGVVYAAAVPGGIIYRCPRDGAPEPICELGVQNVWAMTVSPDGDIWAATGNQGKLFRVASDGTASLVLSVRDRHITCMAGGDDGTLYLGTSPLGKIYAVSLDGEVRSVGEIEKAAIQSMAVDSAGHVYVGTSPNGRVFKIEPEGAVREIFRAKGKHIQALLAMDDDVVLAASGPGARLTAIFPDENSALMYSPKAAFLADLALASADQVCATVADTGNIVKLDFRGPRTGRFTSNPHDAGARARWGAVRWRGSLPAGTEIAIDTRTGATSQPDETWSPWETTGRGPGSTVHSPANRFLQCRVELTTEDANYPEIEAVEFMYLPANQMPEIKLKSPAGGELWSGRQTIRWTGRDPDRDELEYEVYWSANRGKSWMQIEAPLALAGEENASDAQAGEADDSVASPDSDGEAVSATGSGSDQDESGAETWQNMAAMSEFENQEGIEEIVESKYEEFEEGEDAFEEPQEEPKGDKKAPPFRATSLQWDTTEVSDGDYVLKVVASDARANPDDPRTKEVISPTVVIDNGPPELIIDRRRSDEDPAPASVTAFDEVTYITSAEIRIDKGEWLAAIPEDGIFDGQYEAIMLDEARLPGGAHVLEIRVRDAADNVGSGMLRYRQ